MTSADDLPPLREVIAAHGLLARKSLGQHFLLDLNVTRKIARLADVGPHDTVFEVGPGPGGLTRALLEAGARVVAVERDARCVDALSTVAAAFDSRLEIVEGDALAVNEPAILPAGGPIKIVSNLPYNISTELLVKWLRLNAEARFWSGMALMFQKEVANRILAAPGSKVYGRLSVIAQAASAPRRGLDLPARAFTPPPKVDSTVVVFAPKDIDFDLAALERTTQAAFSQRRKMLRSSMKSIFGSDTEDILGAAGLLATDRAEDVNVAGFIRLAGAASARRTA
ncbi:MAG: 16S rRNA (adenine(1518)-N(6)/adenine(1519)-N(6))-dimethyltransferase RsmA [Alphaproteobacteria bacterium]|nr:16S rRNA (adenine(1518)-N(6)/adenine(1519)-N(6))-dimethyltransferase RsmA [Alphaproteobacteria bacterium]